MIRTLHLTAANPEHLAQAAEILRAGGLVAFPTETVYGLGANALSGAAVERIFAAKGRPAWDPLIVHVPDLAAAEAVARIPMHLRSRTNVLGETFWPGPMTLLLPRQPVIPKTVTAGRELVGVRVPAHPAALALLRGTGLPLAAPSANRFGHTSPTTAQHVLDDLDGRIEAVLDGGACAVGVESTVLDPAQTPMLVYRSGTVTTEALQQATGVAAVLFAPEPTSAVPESLPSPGVGIRHYAPGVPVWLSEGTEAALWRRVEQVAVSGGGGVGVLLPCDWTGRPAEPCVLEPCVLEPCVLEPCVLEPWGCWADVDSLGRELFAALRSLEDRGVAAMVAPLPPPGGKRDAVRDRLQKAARPL